MKKSVLVAIVSWAAAIAGFSAMAFSAVSPSDLPSVTTQPVSAGQTVQFWRENKEVIKSIFGAGGAGTLIIQWALKRNKIWKQRRRAAVAKASTEKKIETANLKRPASWAPEFRRQVKATSEAASEEIASAASPFVGAELIVVISGKGGVGKSTLSLGLLEYYSRTSRTMLVDFDMHNRGLTSLFNLDGDHSTNVLDQMKRFQDLFAKSGLKDETDPHKEYAQYLSLREEFAKKAVGQTLLLNRTFVSGERVMPVGAKGTDRPVDPSQASFLPSIKPPDRFLGSPIFNAGFKEVFYFLKCLSYWAAPAVNPRELGQVGTIVVDCHGAHDLFMVGAIHAASKLVVVATPEPGSFDGTLDLIAFARDIQAEVPHSTFPSVLVMNNCRPYEMDTVADWVNFYAGPPLNGVVTVESDNSIRDIASTYRFGSVAKNRKLWPAIVAAVSVLGSLRTPPPSPSSPPATEQ